MSSPTTCAATFLNNRSSPGDNFHPRQRFSPRLLERAASRHHYLPTAYPSQDVDCSHYYYSPPNRRRSIDPTHSHIRYNSPIRTTTKLPPPNQLQYSGYNPTATAAAAAAATAKHPHGSLRSSSTKKLPRNKTSKHKHQKKMKVNLPSDDDNSDDDSHLHDDDEDKDDDDDDDHSTRRKHPTKNTATNNNDCDNTPAVPTAMFAKYSEGVPIATDPPLIAEHRALFMHHAFASGNNNTEESANIKHAHDNHRESSLRHEEELDHISYILKHWGGKANLKEMDDDIQRKQLSKFCRNNRMKKIQTTPWIIRKNDLKHC